MSEITNLTDAVLDVQIALENLRDLMQTVRATNTGSLPPACIEAVYRLTSVMPVDQLDDQIEVAEECVARLTVAEREM
ncbi:MAG: hypothetical protein NTV22_09760 [bacterium]|nr:hypothetical protein [bacterium]